MEYNVGCPKSHVGFTQDALNENTASILYRRTDTLGWLFKMYLAEFKGPQVTKKFSIIFIHASAGDYNSYNQESVLSMVDLCKSKKIKLIEG